METEETHFILDRFGISTLLTLPASGTPTPDPGLPLVKADAPADSESDEKYEVS